MTHSILLTAYNQQATIPIAYPSYRSALIALRTLRGAIAVPNVTMTIVSTTTP